MYLYKEKSESKRLFVIILNHFADLLILNLLFVITSLPVVTISTSAAAMSKITGFMVQDREVHVLRDYLHYFRKNLKDGLKAFLLTGIPLAVMIFSFSFYYINSKNYKFFALPAVLCVFCLILFCFSMIYFFHIVANVSLKIKDALKNAVILSFLYIRKTLVCLCTIILSALLTVLLLPYSFPLLVLIFFSFLSVVCSYLVLEPIEQEILRLNQDSADL